MNSLKRLFTGLIFSAFVCVYVAPVGMCASNVNLPPLSLSSGSNVNKAVNNQSSFVLNGDIKISKKNPLITLSLRESDIRQVLRMFADKAGMNIIIHNSINERFINRSFSL